MAVYVFSANKNSELAHKINSRSHFVGCGPAATADDADCLELDSAIKPDEAESE